ncbi:MAG TPA: aldehyde dehydrogenase family protein [Pseudonocardiaceae bacterium]|nr:aldehyde dehydrogenase family protein [Pseudonocardiaceae bacterium]
MTSSHPVVNPATEQVVADVPLTSATETDEAIERAHRAFPAWAAVTPADRARLLRRFADAVTADVDQLAAIEVANSGHTIGNARWEAGNVADVLNYYSAAPERLFGRQIPVAGGVNLTFAEPLVVVGVIVPWNFPMPIAGWGLAPALAAGNTVVLKPAELTPLTALRLAELSRQAGILEDVFQVLPDEGAVVGERFVTHPHVRKIVFTGSTEVGKRLAARCAEQVKRVTLELGGKNANIVFADADLDKAAATAPYGVFDNAGQDCCARSRILVQRSVFDRFMTLFEPAVHGVKVLDPADPASEMGPLISAAHRDRIASYVDGEVPVAFRGGVPDGPGFWFPPTVLAPVPNGHRVVSEEIFGPVVTMQPFGGFKQSGLGRELGPDALAAFTETKNVFISTD